MPVTGCRGAEQTEDETPLEPLQEALSLLDEAELSFLKSER